MPTMTCISTETEEKHHIKACCGPSTSRVRAASSHLQSRPKHPLSTRVRGDHRCCEMILACAGYSSQVGMMSGRRPGCPHLRRRTSLLAHTLVLEGLGFRGAGWRGWMAIPRFLNRRVPISCLALSLKFPQNRTSGDLTSQSSKTHLGPPYAQFVGVALRS